MPKIASSLKNVGKLCIIVRVHDLEHIPSPRQVAVYYGRLRRNIGSPEIPHHHFLTSSSSQLIFVQSTVLKQALVSLPGPQGKQIHLT